MEATKESNPKRRREDSNNGEGGPSIDSKDASDRQSMNLGAFSLSLPVKDLKVAQEFYEKLGFRKIDGTMMTEEMGFAIMKNGEAKVFISERKRTSSLVAASISPLANVHRQIGLFQGMFEHPLISFNPPDLRAIAQHVKEIDITTESGPCNATITDPDGNKLFFDQV